MPDACPHVKQVPKEREGSTSNRGGSQGSKQFVHLIKAFYALLTQQNLWNSNFLIQDVPHFKPSAPISVDDRKDSNTAYWERPETLMENKEEKHADRPPLPIIGKHDE